MNAVAKQSAPATGDQLARDLAAVLLAGKDACTDLAERIAADLDEEETELIRAMFLFTARKIPR
jgi:hypothetical protein